MDQIAALASAHAGADLPPVPAGRDRVRMRLAGRLARRSCWWGTAAAWLWGYLQYRLVGRYRGPRAGGGPGMETMPERILDHGPYRYTRNPMYLGHLIFLTGLAITFWSWFALILLAARALWFHCRVLQTRRGCKPTFGAALRCLSRPREALDAGV